MEHDFDDYPSPARATPITTSAPDDDETPPESRASPSFSFHEERRLLKSDEYWLAHKIPRLPPAALSTSPSASIAALDGLSLSRYDFRDDKTDGGDESRQSTLITPTEEMDPSAVTQHRERMDTDERLALAEEREERQLDSGLPADQFDTGESPHCGQMNGGARGASITPLGQIEQSVLLLLLLLCSKAGGCIHCRSTIVVLLPPSTHL